MSLEKKRKTENCSSKFADNFSEIEKAKSENDPRGYSFSFLENDLRVVLVKTPSLEEKSAVCLCVNSGSVNDPVEFPGLSHFLEHVLFMGTKKFPKENHFGNFISKFNGFTNAFTDFEYTCFYFEIQTENLKTFLKSFDIFLQFFICPLFNGESCQNEIEAIESEFQQVKLNDAVRIEQVLAHDNKDNLHVWNRFFWGNRESLKNPKEMTEKILPDFFKKFYVGNFMTLSVVSPLDSEKIGEFIKSHEINKIPKGNDPLQKFSSRPYKADKFYLVKSIRNPLNKLHVLWQLDSVQQSPKRRAIFHYIVQMIGSEAPFSIASILKRENLIKSLCAVLPSDGYGTSASVCVFSVVFDLTEKGLGKIGKILTCLFSFVEKLQQENFNNHEEKFNELLEIGKLSYKFLDLGENVDYAEALAVRLLPSMKNENFEFLLASSFFLDVKFDAQELDKNLDFLKDSKNSVVLLQSSETEIFANKKLETEKWFGVEYFADPKKLHEIFPIEKDEKSEFLQKSEFEPPNRFLVKNLEIFAENENFKIPGRFGNETLKIENLFIHSGADLFKRPKTFLTVLIFNNSTADDFKVQILLSFLVNVLSFQIEEGLFDAHDANFGVNLAKGIFPNSLSLFLSGFSEKILEIFNEISEMLKRPNFDDFFEISRENLEQIFLNEFRDPFKCCEKIQSQNLYQKEFRLTKEKMEIFRSIDKNQLKEFWENFQQNFSCKIALSGNVNDEMADFLKSPESFFRFGQDERPKFFWNFIEKDKIFKIKNVEPKDKNEVIRVAFTDEKKIFMELAESIFDEPIFDVLRNKEQLGYSVGVEFTDDFEMAVLTFFIQSSEFSCKFLYERLLKFLENFIGNFSIDEFEEFRDALAAEKVEPFQNLGELHDNLVDQISKNRMTFWKHFEEAEEIKKIKFEEFCEFLGNFLKKKRKIFCCHSREDFESPDENFEIEELKIF